jgi:preprotein translocase subunit YajC
MFLATLLLLAEANEGAAQPQPGRPDLMLWMLPLIAVLFYFLMVRPARRQEQQQKAMLNALKKNDKVLTAGGLIGTVAAIKDNEDEITLKVDENSNVKVRVTKSSVVRVLHSAEGGKEQKEGSA